ncbi:MAG: sugar phosphate isomerase/epimerase family protein [Pseudomonadota bacterium]
MLSSCVQTITWGDPQHHLFDGIFELAAESGFQGLEIGYRRLSAIDTGDMQALLEKYGLVVSASHIGGNLADLGQAAGERDDLDGVLTRLYALKIPYLLYSGLNEADDEVLDASIRALNTTANRCADRGITLLYHNHDWEFADGGRIWHRLLDSADPKIGFAPDLGWMAKAGEDLGSMLDLLGDRIKVLHFKDFISSDPGQDTCHLGEGIIDLDPAWAWLASRTDRDMWVTAEQDHAEDADRACQLNGAYMVDQLASLEGTSA